MPIDLATEIQMHIRDCPMCLRGWCDECAWLQRLEAEQRGIVANTLTSQEAHDAA